MDDPVAFAGSGFKFLAVKDGHSTALIANDSKVAKTFGSEGDFGTRSPEGHRERFVGHRKLVFPYPVPNHQQAAGEPLPDAV
jgi:hypothetical protein